MLLDVILDAFGCHVGCFWVPCWMPLDDLGAVFECSWLRFWMLLGGCCLFGCVWITLRTLLGAIHIFKKENVCGKEEHSCRDFAVADLMGCH